MYTYWVFRCLSSIAILTPNFSCHKGRILHNIKEKKNYWSFFLFYSNHFLSLLLFFFSNHCTERTLFWPPKYLNHFQFWHFFLSENKQKYSWNVFFFRVCQAQIIWKGLWGCQRTSCVFISHFCITIQNCTQYLTM